MCLQSRLALLRSSSMFVSLCLFVDPKRPRLEDKKEESYQEPGPNLARELLLEEASKCAICLDIWDNIGDHRLVSLKCGHLFGLSCINDWLKRGRHRNGSCPECKAKASKKDIRVLFAKVLVAADAEETHRVKTQLQAEVDKCKVHMQELEKLKNLKQHHEIEIDNLKSKYATLKKDYEQSLQRQSVLCSSNITLQLSKKFPIDSGRVLAYNSTYDYLFVSSKTGIRRLYMANLNLSAVHHFHSDQIRDICFQNDQENLLLTAAQDKKFSLIDVRTWGRTQEILTTDPLWSCCWSKSNKFKFCVGSTKGNIFEYDLRNFQFENLSDGSADV